jgi:predicted ester cyclase
LVAKSPGLWPGLFASGFGPAVTVAYNPCEKGIDMAQITTVAEEFFDACETGKGWEVCSAYCTPDATFSAQASPLSGVKTLAQYADWMKGILTLFPDARYELKSFATDAARNNVAAYAVFYATHTGEGGPVPPTGRRMITDYVYVMQFEGEKIAHMTKVWNAELALKEIGWA